MDNTQPSFWRVAWKQFKKHPLGYWSLWVVALFCLVAIYAPFLASSKPLIVKYEGQWYFPLFRYLFFKGFYTKNLDQFYNLLIFTFPLFLIAWFSYKTDSKKFKIAFGSLITVQFILFGYLVYRPQQDPASNATVNAMRQNIIRDHVKASQMNPLLAIPQLISWNEELHYLTPYAKLNLILRYQQRKEHHDRLKIYEKAYTSDSSHRTSDKVSLPTLWKQDLVHEGHAIVRHHATIHQLKDSYPHAKTIIQSIHQSCDNAPLSSLLPAWITCELLTKLPKDEEALLKKDKQIVDDYEKAQAQIKYLKDQRKWLEKQSSQLSGEVMPLLRHFHWEDDAGGDQTLNRYVSWWDLTRINRKDMVASLIFGVRISLSVGLLAIGLALLIGIPIGAAAGYYGGRVDIITYRLIEIWESMPTFFMLLLVVAFLQSKSIFLVIAVIGFFGWTGFSRFVRGEFFRQKQMPYVEACHALGYNDTRIMFSHLLPNAIPPLLTLVPFAIMGAITSEAGLSFLGLGEEGSSSWGVLMDEGRTAFPSESYLLWPPALLLTLLLVSVALVGDALRDALDPKLHKE